MANIYYWGFNQYIIQRTLAAKSIKEAQKGILLAAGLKIIIPLIVVIPGIAAFVMVNDPGIMASLGDAGQLSLPTTEQADKAYPWLLQFLPTGLKGVGSRKRLITLPLIRATSLSKPFSSVELNQVMEPVENMAPPLGVSKKTTSAAAHISSEPG